MNISKEELEVLVKHLNSFYDNPTVHKLLTIYRIELDKLEKEGRAKYELFKNKAKQYIGKYYCTDDGSCIQLYKINNVFNNGYFAENCGDFLIDTFILDYDAGFKVEYSYDDNMMERLYYIKYLKEISAETYQKILELPLNKISDIQIIKSILEGKSNE